MRHDDLQVGKIRRQIVDGGRVRVPDPRTHSARHARAHAGGADVDHHGRLELVDKLEQRVVAPVVDGEVLHDRVEVKADKPQLALRPRFQYLASASTYGPWHAIHSFVPG